MKKGFYTIVSLLFITGSCTYNSSFEGKDKTDESRIEILRATIVSTRSSIDAAGHFSWGTNDDIAVHRSVNGYEIAPLTLDGSFNVHLQGSETRDGYAIYPARIATESSAPSELVVCLPNNYTIPSEGMNTEAPLPMVAINDSEEEDLAFRHIGGVIRLSLDNVPYETATLSIQTDKRITGDFTVGAPLSMTPSIITDNEEPDAIEFQLKVPLNVIRNNYILHIPVPTGTYSSISVEARDFSNNLLASGDASVSLNVGRAEGVSTSLALSMDSKSIPLCIKAVQTGTISISNPLSLSIEYSFDNQSWTSSSNSSIHLTLERGHSVFLRGNNESYAIEGEYTSLNNIGNYYKLTDNSNYTNIQFNEPCYVFGNVMSLTNGAEFLNPTAVELTEPFTFAGLFKGNHFLLSHPSLKLHLPATVLKEHCYDQMFTDCDQMVTAPELPATSVVDYCYFSMFEGCSNLSTTVTLDALNLSPYCYARMFYDCKSITSIPSLPATEIADYCYLEMFCSSGLTTPPALPATTMKKYCYCSMFENTAITSVPELPATNFQFANGCYRGLFKKCKNIVSVPSNLLQAEVINNACYQSMFSECSNLSNAPALPAKSLPNLCYNSMFYKSGIVNAPEIDAITLTAQDCCTGMFKDCSNLINAPSILRPSTLTNNCYKEMFMGCKNLQNAPELPALELASECYQKMFSGCEKLSSVKALFLTQPGTKYTFEWLDGVASTGTFYKNPEATWDEDPGFAPGVTTVPDGWLIP